MSALERYQCKTPFWKQSFFIIKAEQAGGKKEKESSNAFIKQ